MSSLAISFKGLEEFLHLTTPPAATPDAERAEKAKIPTKIS